MCINIDRNNSNGVKMKNNSKSESEMAKISAEKISINNQWHLKAKKWLAAAGENERKLKWERNAEKKAAEEEENNT